MKPHYHYTRNLLSVKPLAFLCIVCLSCATVEPAMLARGARAPIPPPSSFSFSSAAVLAGLVASGSASVPAPTLRGSATGISATLPRARSATYRALYFERLRGLTGYLWSYESPGMPVQRLARVLEDGMIYRVDHFGSPLYALWRILQDGTIYSVDNFGTIQGRPIGQVVATSAGGRLYVHSKPLRTFPALESLDEGDIVEVHSLPVEGFVKVSTPSGLRGWVELATLSIGVEIKKEALPSMNMAPLIDLSVAAGKKSFVW